MNVPNFYSNVITQLKLLLENNGFTTYLLKSLKEKFCFDILAKNDASLIVIKIISNIDNISEDLLDELKFFSKIVQAIPIIIGEKNRRSKLENNTIYIRKNLPIINVETFKLIIHNKVFPYILAKKGGGTIFLDGNRLRLMREEKEVSRKNFSDMIGITKRSLCSYERGVMRTSIETANKIQKIFDDTIIRKINIFNWKFQVDINEFLDLDQDRTEFQEQLEGILKDIGFFTFWAKDNIIPYDLFITSKNLKSFEKIDDFYPVCFSINQTQKVNKPKIKDLIKMSQILQKKYLHIVESYKTSNLPVNMPVIQIKDLEKIDDEEEFKEFVKELKL